MKRENSNIKLDFGGPIQIADVRNIAHGTHGIHGKQRGFNIPCIPWANPQVPQTKINVPFVKMSG